MDILNKIICGDSLEIMKNMPDESVDFVLTSPPYNLGIKYDIWNDDLTIEDYFNWCEKWIKELYRIIRSPGRFALVHYLSCGRAEKRFAPLMNLNVIAEKCGFKHHGLAIWYDITISKFTAWGSWLDSSAPYINCVFPETKVITRYGYKLIKDIKSGEDVLTHTGSLRRVVKVYNKKYSGKAIKITSRLNLATPIFVLGEHKFLVIKRTTKFIRDKRVHEFSNPYWESANNILKEFKKTYGTADDVRFYLSYPLTQSSEIEKIFENWNDLPLYNKKFWGFVGLFLAEGCLDNMGIKTKGRKFKRKGMFLNGKYIRKPKVYYKVWNMKREGYSLREIADTLHVNKRYVKKIWEEVRSNDLDAILSDRIEFSHRARRRHYDIHLTVNEKEFERVKTLLEDIGTHYRAYKRKNVVQVEISNKRLWMFLSMFFKKEAFSIKGGKAHCKKIPEFVFSLPKEFLGALVEWYAFGDACSFPKGKNITTVAVSASYDLLLDIQRILLLLGKASVLSKAGKALCNHHQCYTLRWNKGETKFNKIFLVDNHVFFAIKEIEEIEVENQEVYDLSIYKDNSYVIEPLAVVHNSPLEGIDILYKGSWKRKGEKDELTKEEFMMGCSGIWKIPPERNRIHPAPFPEKLAELAIKLFTNKEDIVLDPFVGSGTTCVAATKLGRKYIGIDISPEYCKMAEERLRNIQKTLF